MMDAEILASKPRISVLMPTFNSAKFLQAAMNSVFRQTCQNFEFLIVDDASSDDTIKIINSYHDKRIRIVQQGSRKGLAAALNLGLREAKGVYVARFDSDDLSYPHRFEQQVAFLDAHKDISILGTWQYHFGKTNHIHRGVATHEELQIVSMFYCDLCRSTLMLRRNDIIKNDLFFSENSPIEDLELWQKSLLKVKFANMPIVLGACRVSGDSITDIKRNVLSLYETKIKVKHIHNLLQLDINKKDYDLIPSYKNPLDGKDSLEKIRYIKRFDNLLHKMEERNKKIKLFNPELMRQCLTKVRVNLLKNQHLFENVQSDFKAEVVKTKEIEVLKRPVSILSQKAFHIRGKEGIPRVSIIMPTKDNSEFLCEALDSISGQTFKDWELIIVDDSSTEDVRKIVTSYRESRFQFVKGLNIGISSAHNIGLDYAHGEYIARMDADDVSYKTRISKQVEFMDNNPDIGVCDTEFVTNENYFRYRENKKHQQFYTNMLYMQPICHPTVMFRGSVTKKANLRYDETFGTGEDFEFLSRIIFMHNIKFARISEPLLMYRIHSNNSSKKEHNGKKNYLSVIRRNFHYVLGIELDEMTMESFWIKKDYKFTFKKIKMLRKNYDTITSIAKVKADHNIDVSQLKDWLNCRFNKIKREAKSYKTIIRKNATKILETVLYIKNEGRHKVIRLFGLKIKIKSRQLMLKQELSQQKQELTQQKQIQRCSMLSITLTKMNQILSQKSFTDLDLTDSYDHNRITFYRDILRLNKQTLAFYVEILPFFWGYIQESKIPLYNAYTLLDVGCRTGSGSNLYGELFSDEGWGYCIKLLVDTIDLDATWNEYIELLPFIKNHSNGNLFDIQENSYDICLCSHTIEYVDDPVKFVKQLKKVSKYFSLITCPFNETDPIIGHRTITREIIDLCEPKKSHYYKSVNRWKEDLEMVVFIV